MTPAEAAELGSRAVDLVRTATGSSERAAALRTHLTPLLYLIGVRGSLDWAGWADLEGETRRPEVLMAEATEITGRILAALPEVPAGGFNGGAFIMEKADFLSLKAGVRRALFAARRKPRVTP